MSVLPASYLDHNATTPLIEAARHAMADVLGMVGNPSSVHGFGRGARRLVDRAREQVAAAIGATASTIAFTGSGTEANNLALTVPGAGPVVVSAVEHDSVRLAAEDALLAPVDHTGVIDLAAFEYLLARARPRLVSVMLANNETGVVQPIAHIARLARAAGAAMHCDAIQAAGKIRVDVAELGIDMLSLSAHKLGGPQGVGALYIREGALEPVPMMRGGGQEKRRRAGTENVAGIVGFGVATTAVGSHLMNGAALAKLRDAAETRLKALAPSARVFGAGAVRLPNTLCIAMPGVPAETQVIALDLAGVAVSAGSACSSGKVAASHVLEAMGGDAETARCAIRISFGSGNSMADVDRLVQAWGALYARHSMKRLQPSSAA